MNTTFYFADQITGRFDGSYADCFDVATAFHSAPEGTVPIAGVRDHQRQRFDFTTGELCACDPLPFAAEQLASMLLEKYQAQIQELETRKLRPMGALLLDPTNQEERTRLLELEQQLAAIRAALARVRGTELPQGEMLLLAQQLRIVR